MLRHSLKAFSQCFFLSRNTDRAIIGVANAGHDAALSNHRHRTEAEFLGTQHRCDHNIPTRFQAAIGPKQNSITQSVFQQRAMHFREAKFPRATGVLNRTER